MQRPLPHLKDHFTLEVSRITDLLGLASIAQVKLCDLGNTNGAGLDQLYDAVEVGAISSDGRAKGLYIVPW